MKFDAFLLHSQLEQPLLEKQLIILSHPSSQKKNHSARRPLSWASTFMPVSVENYVTHKKNLCLKHSHYTSSFHPTKLSLANTQTLKQRKLFFFSALFITSNIDMKVTYVVHKHLARKKERGWERVMRSWIENWSKISRVACWVSFFTRCTNLMWLSTFHGITKSSDIKFRNLVVLIHCKNQNTEHTVEEAVRRTLSNI